MAEHAAGIVNRFGTSGEGTAYNTILGAEADVVLSDYPGIGIDLLFRGEILTTGGGFLSGSMPATWLNAAESARWSPVIDRFRLNMLTNDVRLNIVPQFHYGRYLRLGIGGSVAYRFSTVLTEYEEIVTPAEARFTPENRSERLIASRAEIESRRLRYGAVLALSYRFPISRVAALVPELRGRADLTALALEHLGTQALDVGGGISLLFNLFPPPPDTIVSPAPVLRALLDLFQDDGGADSGAAVIAVERTIHRQHVSILPMIFFDRNSGEIPERYAALQPAETDAFNRRSLAGLDPLAIHARTLDILGMRMRRDSVANIMLAGTFVQGESEGLARGRGEAVRAYLHDIWGISKSRMEIAVDHAVPSGSPAGVFFRTASAGLLSPVSTEWIARDFQPPKIGLRRTITAGAGVRRWELIVRRGDDTVSYYTGTGNADTAQPYIDFRLGDMARSAPSVSLSAELIVEDGAGGRVSVRDTLPVVIADAGQGAAREIIMYEMPADRGNRAIIEANRELIDRLPQSLHRDGKVTIDGPANHAGDPDHRKWVLGGVGEEVLAVIGGDSIRPAELRLLQRAKESSDGSPRLPEGEYIFDGVRVMIEQEAWER
ncbi:MAG: hypothetical protein ABIR47_16715 [Candidatus Kapaibacterium sp.]